MSNIPQFSVLIANHNDGRFLMDAIQSVRQQSFTDWEIVVLDDGSDDNSKSIYSDLQNDTRIRILFNDSCRGCGYTKHRLVDEAAGEICGFLDADDALTPDALQIMVEEHLAHPECSLIYSQYYVADSQLNINSISAHQQQIPYGKSFLDFPFSGYISHFATFKRADYLKTIGIDEQAMMAVDIDLYLRLEEVGQTLFIPQPLYLYRTETGNNISMGDNAFMARQWELSARIEACRRRGADLSDCLYHTHALMNQNECLEAYRKGADSIRSSYSYRLGYFLLTPLRLLSNLFRR